MARPPRNALAIEDFKRNMAKITRNNRATAKDIELWAYATHGMKVGPESIRKALVGEIDPTQCAIELLLVIEEFYGVAPERMGKFAAERLRPVSSLTGGGGPHGGGRHKRTGSSGWLDRIPA